MICMNQNQNNMYTCLLLILQEAEEEKNNPAFIPRRDTFWGHDDRWTDIPEEDRYMWQ